MSLDDGLRRALRAIEDAQGSLERAKSKARQAKEGVSDIDTALRDHGAGLCRVNRLERDV